MAKINISIDDELLAKIDKLAEENYTSRSGFICIGMNEFVQHKEITSAIKSMSYSFAKIASNGSLDDETLQELDTIQKYCELFTK